MRKLLNRLDPTRQLPQTMRRYLALPTYLVLGWLVISGLALFIASRVDATAPATPPAESSATPPGENAAAAAPEQPAADAPAEDSEAPPADPLLPDISAMLADGAEIGASGSSVFTIRGSAGQVSLESGGQTLTMLGDGNELRLLDPNGATVYRLKAKQADKGKLYDAAGTFRWRVKCESEGGEEGCKLYDPDGNKLHRVKIKADSFNVYGSGDQRLYKGKLKNGRYQVRDETGNNVLDIRGAASLKQAALLALPVDAPVRALLWAYAGHESPGETR